MTGDIGEEKICSEIHSFNRPGRPKTKVDYLLGLALGQVSTLEYVLTLGGEMVLLSLGLIFCLCLKVFYAAFSAAAQYAVWVKWKSYPVLGRPELRILGMIYTFSVISWFIGCAWLILQHEILRPNVFYILLALFGGFILLDALVAHLATVGWEPVAGKYQRTFKIILRAISRLLPGTSKKPTLNSLDKVKKAEGAASGKQEDRLLKGWAAFGASTAKKAMQPRAEITAFDITLNFHELMDKINKSGYSRVPVFRENLDWIEGVLYVKDLLPFIQRNEKFNWQKLLRKAFFIPENKMLIDLMKDFQERRIHVAIVVDEHGGTAGLITLEDVIEEVFGDINDEYDEESPAKFIKIDNETFIFEGKVLISDFCKELGVPENYFSKIQSNSESIAGLLLGILERLPKAAETVTYKNIHFTIQSADKRHIKRVKVVKTRSAENY